MFMEKVELEQTIKLYKLRSKESNGTKGIFALLVFVALIDIIALVKEAFSYNTEVISISFQTISTAGFIMGIIAVVLYTVGYIDFYKRYQIFPSTDKSKFLSYSLFCYLSIIKIQLVSLGIYLVQVVLNLAINFFTQNIKFAYNFSVQFIILGFIVTVIYNFLIISLCILLGALDRKYKWWFRIIFVAVMVLSFRDNNFNYIVKMLGFITKEHSIFLFIIKAIILMIILFGTSYLFNSLTNNAKENQKPTYMELIKTAVLILVLYFVLISLFRVVVINNYSSGVTEHTETNEKLRILEDDAESIVDVTELKEGSTIYIKSDMIDKEKYNIIYGDHLTNPSDHKILLNFTPIREHVDWVNIYLYTDPVLDVKLNGNDLIININNKDNIKVMFISPYKLMGQFDMFKDKNYFNGNMGSMRGSGTGIIEIYLPEGKNLKVIE